jgi:hypothetical protein
MDEQFASTIWEELKRYINTVDRSEAAEALVNILVDNDIDANDIRSAFAGDRDIKAALANYTNDDVEELESEDEDIEDWDE